MTTISLKKSLTPKQAWIRTMTIRSGLAINCSVQGSDADVRSRDGDGDWNHRFPSFQAKNCHHPEKQAQASSSLSHEIPITTYTTFLQLLVPWVVASDAATMDQPAKTRRTWHVLNQSPKSAHRATAPQQATPQSWEATLEEGRPPANTPLSSL